MKKLLTTAVALFITSQANAAIYGITYTFESDAAATPLNPNVFYMYSRELLTPLPDPTHIYNSPPSYTVHAGGATPILGTGTLDTVTGDIVLNGIDLELVIPSGSIGFFDYTQTLHGFFTGTTYTNTSSEASWDTFVCEQGFELKPPCVNGGLIGAGKVDPDGIVFDQLGVGGKGSFFEQNGAFPFIETRMNFEIVTPIPAAAWLFGSALLGLAGIGRHRR